MLLLDILAAAAAGALTGAGVGGGSLLLLYLTLAKEIPQLEAQGINLLYFLAASGPALFFHLKSGLVYRQGGMWAAFSGAGACLLGGWLAGVLDPVWLKKVFGAVLLFMGLGQLFGGKSRRPEQEERQSAQR